MPIEPSIPMSINIPETDWAGAYQKGLDVIKAQRSLPLDIKAKEQDNRLGHLNNAAKTLHIVGTLLSNVKDQQSYSQARQIAIGRGLGTPQDIPEAYDPNIVNAWSSAARDGLEGIQRQRLEFEQNGGVVGAIVSKIQKDPAFRDAYFNKANANKGLTTDPDSGQVANMPGYNEAVGSTAFEESRQEQRGELTGRAQGAQDKKAIEAPNVLMLVEQAEKLLPSATSGLAQRAVRGVANLAGVSTNASKADRQLEVISAALTAGVPRMEGPQSNYDVQLYKQAAADVANPDIPYEDRLAALGTIKTLQKKYQEAAPAENIPTGGNINKSPISKSKALEILRQRGHKL